MSTTAPVPAPVPAPGLDPAADARGYAAAVRAELADLPPEVVEELTGGLEADLAELAAESATPLLDRLGGPRAYADELRSAAGLPGRDGTAASHRVSPLAAPFAEARRDALRLRDHLRSRPWWPGAVDRAVQLRPAWWVLRGALGGWVLAALLGGRGLLALLVVLAAAAASLEVGRRSWTGFRQRRLLAAGNVLAVLVLPFALGALLEGPRVEYVYPTTDAGQATSSDTFLDTSGGVWSDGQVVTNIYPYDAEGRPLTGVQLLDDYGRPLVTSTGERSDWSGGEASPLVPAVGADGALRWNAYPLRVQGGAAGAAPSTPPLPEPALPPLLGATAAPSASPSATAEPAPEPPATAPAAPSPIDPAAGGATLP